MGSPKFTSTSSTSKTPLPEPNNRQGRHRNNEAVAVNSTRSTAGTPRTSPGTPSSPTRMRQVLPHRRHDPTPPDAETDAMARIQQDPRNGKLNPVGPDKID